MYKKRLIAISDTHHSTMGILKIKKIIQPSDYLVHLGDGAKDVQQLECNVLGQVRGNCDGYAHLPKEVEIMFEGKKILLTHGHEYRVKQFLAALYNRGVEKEVDMVLFGHTHQATIEKYQGIYFCNPGSVAYPNQYGKRTMLEITVENGEVFPNILEI